MSRPSFIALVFAAVLGAALLRTVGLDRSPPGMTAAEAKTGYDGYLVWTTGKNRRGGDFSVTVTSAGGSSFAPQRWLAAPFVGVLGPTPAHARLPAALIGSLMVLAVALAVRPRLGPGAAIAAAAFTAIAPLAIHFSRLALEPILMPFFVSAAWAFFEHARARRSARPLWGAAIALILSLMSSDWATIFVPLWLLGLIFFERAFFKEALGSTRLHVLGPALLLLAAAIPIGWAILSAGPPRFAGGAQLVFDHARGEALAYIFLNNYLTAFDPGQIFVRGSPQVHQSILGLGALNLIELPLIAIALAALGRRPAPTPAPAAGGDARQLSKLLVYWVLVGTLPAAISWEMQNFGRLLGWLPAPAVLSAIGVLEVTRWAGARSAPARAAVHAAIGAGFVFTVALVVWTVFIAFPNAAPREWYAEVPGALRCAREQRRSKEQIVVSPGLPAAEVMASFLLADLEPREASSPAWLLADLPNVTVGRLYVAPAAADGKGPGREVCRVKGAGLETAVYASTSTSAGHPAGGVKAIVAPNKFYKTFGVPLPTPQPVAPQPEQRKR